MNIYARKLHLSDSLRNSLVRTIIKSLNLPKGSTGVDIGCGIGSNTELLAEAIGPFGRVVGVDLSYDVLKYARKKAGGLSQLVFHKSDMNALCLRDNAFDWAWSMDCVGYLPEDGDLSLKEMARIVKPGGHIFILAWSSQQLLPGYPQLESRLNQTATGILPFVNGRPPSTHFLRALGWFETAGIKECTAQTFVENIQPPFDDDKKKALISLFHMRWGDPQSELSESDYLAFTHLCRPDSPNFILSCHDYYGFFTYTLFQGTVVQ